MEYYLSYRRFSIRDEAVADEWYCLAQTRDEWTLGDAIGQGEAGSFWATRLDGVRAVAKPALDGDMPRGAHEKIASDLAKILDIPVPPVVLWVNPADGQRYSLSLMAFSQVATWGEASERGVLTLEFRAATIPIFSAGYPFHIWIADSDHWSDDQNLVLDISRASEKPAIAFIDHAFSMSYSWHEGVVGILTRTFYYFDIKLLDVKVITETIEKIEKLPECLIKNIIDRIPADFISEYRRSLVSQCLLSRQKGLSAALID